MLRPKPCLISPSISESPAPSAAQILDGVLKASYCSVNSQLRITPKQKAQSTVFTTKVFNIVR